ncbi:hypothetical protein Hanom_Chr08g00727821 [Helianthus anomalus]
MRGGSFSGSTVLTKTSIGASCDGSPSLSNLQKNIYIYIHTLYFRTHDRRMTKILRFLPHLKSVKVGLTFDRKPFWELIKNP